MLSLYYHLEKLHKTEFLFSGKLFIPVQHYKLNGTYNHSSNPQQNISIYKYTVLNMSGTILRKYVYNDAKHIYNIHLM